MKNLKRSFSVVCDRPVPSKAVVSQPADPEKQFQLGNQLLNAGRASEAVAIYTGVLAQVPDHLAARFNRANALAASARFEESVQEYREVARRDPNFPNLFINLGVVFVNLARFEESAEAFAEATRRQPQLVQAWNNLGGILGQLERFEEAIDALRHAVALDPNDMDACLNLARALHRTRSREAIAISAAAARRWPRRAETWVALGDAQLHFEETLDALEAYGVALSIDPASLDGSVNLGLAYLQTSRVDEAVDFLARYLERNPAQVDAWDDLAIALATGGFLEQSLGCFRRGLAIEPRSPSLHSNLMVIMSYGVEATPAAMLAEAEQWVKYNVEGPLFPAYPRTDRSFLRIGYVSGDFRHHPVGRFVEQVVLAHDRSRFEVVGYSNYRGSDNITKRIESNVDLWHNVADLSDEELAEQIRKDEIDILIDLSGHTPMNRLPAFGRRLAPVQATWLGYFGTTAMREMDFILTDQVLIPEAEEEFYRERPARMPNGLYFLQNPNLPIQPSSLPALNGPFTFGCFNMVTKITKETIELWAEVLHALPDSRMILNRHAFGAPSVRGLYLGMFAEAGIDPSRIELRATKTREEYLHAYNDVDVMLDTTPFGGGTTSSEALWMGVPVLSLSSDRFPGRMTESVLRTIGIPELVPSDRADFVRLAVELAGDLPRLSELRSTLRAKVEGSRLCDVEAYTRELEGVLEWMWAEKAEVAR